MPDPANLPPAPPPPPAQPAPTTNRFVVLLVIGGIFLIACIGICGGLLAWIWAANPLPSTEQLANLAPINRSPDELKEAIPLLNQATYNHVSIQNRERHSFGPMVVGVGTMSVHADALDGQVRQFVVECTVPYGGDKTTTDAARLAGLSVIQMLDPTFVGDPVRDYMLFADSANGSRNFGAVHVRVKQLISDQRAATTVYNINLAPPGGTLPEKNSGRETYSPPADRYAFKITVEELEAKIPALQTAGRKTTADHGITTTSWADFEVAGQKHTLLAYGEPELLEQLVLRTHIANEGEKIDRMAGMLVAMGLLSHLDPALTADQLEGFTKWSWAALGDEDFGSVNVQLHGQGNDDIGQKIEYTFMPIAMPSLPPGAPAPAPLAPNAAGPAAGE